MSWRRGLGATERRRLQLLAFRAMSYDRKLDFCRRPEEIDGPSPAAWSQINAHLGTSAASLPQLVRELGERRWKHAPKVGDAFCGGGSIPFEAARLGCDAYGSDINPVAGLLTWGALNIVGGGDEVVDRVKAAQCRVFEEVRKQVDEWRIERSEEGWIADAYLYCNEVLDPATGWRVPLPTSWVIMRREPLAVARLVPNRTVNAFRIEIIENASELELEQAVIEGTWRNGVRCPVDRDGTWIEPNHRQITSISQLRGPQGLRLWTNEDVIPRVEDVYQERLYCIRWLDSATGERYYRAPTAADLAREQRVLELLSERLAGWQEKGFIPSRRIESGYNTDQPIRERGWTHWHHLFNPRQLLLLGQLLDVASQCKSNSETRVGMLLSIGRGADWSSRMSVWNSHPSKGGQAENTFLNQALNTLSNYAIRPLSALERIVTAFPAGAQIPNSGTTALQDARAISVTTDVWVTDPGYADAVNYDEVSEFFLAWYEKEFIKLFPEWYADSRRSLNIKGVGEQFRLVGRHTN